LETDAQSVSNSFEGVHEVTPPPLCKTMSRDEKLNVDLPHLEGFRRPDFRSAGNCGSAASSSGF
jgi:hypothetical protein